MNNREQFQIPQLSGAYHRARRQYGLFSALLIIYELIGVELSNEPLAALRIQFKSPQALPYALIILIFYFAFRTTIEWYQSDTKRREQKPSQIDFWVSHSIAIAALLLLSIQRLLNIQVADKFSPNEAFIIPVLTAMLTLTIYNLFLVIRRTKSKLKLFILILHIVIIIFILIQILGYLLNIGSSAYFLLLTFIIFIIAFVGSMVFFFTHPIIWTAHDVS